MGLRGKLSPVSRRFGGRRREEAISGGDDGVGWHGMDDLRIVCCRSEGSCDTGEGRSSPFLVGVSLSTPLFLIHTIFGFVRDLERLF